MELNGARVLVAGATGATDVLGAAITAEPVSRGARVALDGRDPSRPAAAAHPCRPAAAAHSYPVVPTARFDAVRREARPAVGAELPRTDAAGTPVVERRAQ